MQEQFPHSTANGAGIAPSGAILTPCVKFFGPHMPRFYALHMAFLRLIVFFFPEAENARRARGCLAIQQPVSSIAYRYNEMGGESDFLKTELAAVLPDEPRVADKEEIQQRRERQHAAHDEDVEQQQMAEQAAHANARHECQQIGVLQRSALAVVGNLKEIEQHARGEQAQPQPHEDTGRKGHVHLARVEEHHDRHHHQHEAHYGIGTVVSLDKEQAVRKHAHQDAQCHQQHAQARQDARYEETNNHSHGQQVDNQEKGLAVEEPVGGKEGYVIGSAERHLHRQEQQKRYQQQDAPNAQHQAALQVEGQHILGSRHPKGDAQKAEPGVEIVGSRAALGYGEVIDERTAQCHLECGAGRSLHQPERTMQSKAVAHGQQAHDQGQGRNGQQAHGLALVGIDKIGIERAQQEHAHTEQAHANSGLPPCSDREHGGGQGKLHEEGQRYQQIDNAHHNVFTIPKAGGQHRRASLSLCSYRLLVLLAVVGE